MLEQPANPDDRQRPCDSHRGRRIALLIVAFALGLTPNPCSLFAQGRTFPRPLEADEVGRMEPAKLKELIRRGQDQIEVTPRLDGVLILEGKLQPSEEPGIRTLVLKGRMRVAQQGPHIVQVMTDVLQSESFWSTQDDEFAISTASLEIVQPSRDLSLKYYTSGVELFLSGQYEQAENAFTSALADSSQRQAVQYWKAAAAIAMRQPERAERRLEALLRRDPAGSRNHASELQRFQGPLRQSLAQMEERVLLKIRQGGTASP